MTTTESLPMMLNPTPPPINVSTNTIGSDTNMPGVVVPMAPSLGPTVVPPPGNIADSHDAFVYTTPPPTVVLPGGVDWSQTYPPVAPIRTETTSSSGSTLRGIAIVSLSVFVIVCLVAVCIIILCVRMSRNCRNRQFRSNAMTGAKLSANQKASAMQREQEYATNRQVPEGGPSAFTPTTTPYVSDDDEKYRSPNNSSSDNAASHVASYPVSYAETFATANNTDTAVGISFPSSDAAAFGAPALP